MSETKLATKADLKEMYDRMLPYLGWSAYAGLVPAAGSDNEGKYLDNNGNWTDPLENLVQNSGGKVLVDIPKNTYASYILAFNAIIDVLDTLSYEQLSSIVLRFGLNYFAFGRTQSNRSNYSFFQIYITSTENNYGLMRLLITAKDMGIHIGRWDFATSNTNPTYVNEDKSSAAQDASIQLIDTSVSATMIGKINRSDIYDTTEKVVGKWTDGRPLYQKTFIGTLTATSAIGTEIKTIIDIGASVDSVAEMNVFVKNATSDTYQPVFTYWIENNSFIRAFVWTNTRTTASERNKIVIANAWFTGSTTYIATLAYTKTTDAANSYNYADENDYSTSEKIIGKWIDGKTLYQKTIELGALPNNNNKKVAHNISGLSKIVSISGVATNGIAALTLPDVDPNSIDNATRVLCTSDGYVQLINKVDRSSFNGYVTLKYTKS